MHQNGDNHIQNFNFGRFIVVYMVGNHILWLRSRITVKLNSRPYIRRYTSPNENLEYSYPVGFVVAFDALLLSLLMGVFCSVLVSYVYLEWSFLILQSLCYGRELVALLKYSCCDVAVSVLYRFFKVLLCECGIPWSFSLSFRILI